MFNDWQWQTLMAELNWNVEKNVRKILPRFKRWPRKCLTILTLPLEYEVTRSYNVLMYWPEGKETQVNWFFRIWGNINKLLCYDVLARRKRHRLLVLYNIKYKKLLCNDETDWREKRQRLLGPLQYEATTKIYSAMMYWTEGRDGLLGLLEYEVTTTMSYNKMMELTEGKRDTGYLILRHECLVPWGSSCFPDLPTARLLESTLGSCCAM